MGHKIILLTLVVATCFEIECNVKILNGLKVDISKFPYQVSLHLYDYYYLTFICGGSIIGDRHILTAAHCVQNKKLTYFVRYGSNFPNKGGDLYSVRKIFNHPNFNNLSLDCDLSLLVLEKSIILSKNAAEISLPKKDNILRIGYKALISGWGQYSKKQDPGDSSLLSLRYAEIELIGHNKCVKDFGCILKRTVTTNMMCADTKGKDACAADSGGPAVFNGTLVGIISWGDGYGGNLPAVFTKVSQFVEWIEGEIKSNPT